MNPELLVPSSFSPKDFLPPDCSNRQCWDAMFFMSTIARKTIHSKDLQEGGYTRLNRQMLNQTMDSHTSKKTIDSLLAFGAVERTGRPIPGVCSYEYRLSPEKFIDDRLIPVPVTDRIASRRILASIFRAGNALERMLARIHKDLRSSQKQAKVADREDKKDADSMKLKRNAFGCQHALIDAIARGEHYFSLSEYGRVFNCATGLKRELRKHLYVEGENLAGIDISNSQIAFLAKVISDEIKNRVKNEVILQDQGEEQAGKQGRREESIYAAHFDWSSWQDRMDGLSFADVASGGMFWDEMQIAVSEKTGDWIDREGTKQGFLMHVLAPKRIYDTPFRQHMRERYGVVEKYIRWANRNDYRTVIRMLQRAEADFVISTVCQLLFDRHPGIFVLTLHDQVLVAESKLGDLRQAFDDAMKMVDFRFALREAA